MGPIDHAAEDVPPQLVDPERMGEAYAQGRDTRAELRRTVRYPKWATDGQADVKEQNHKSNAQAKRQSPTPKLHARHDVSARLKQHLMPRASADSPGSRLCQP